MTARVLQVLAARTAKGYTQYSQRTDGEKDGKEDLVAHRQLQLPQPRHRQHNNSRVDDNVETARGNLLVGNFSAFAVGLGIPHLVDGSTVGDKGHQEGDAVAGRDHHKNAGNALEAACGEDALV